MRTLPIRRSRDSVRLVAVAGADDTNSSRFHLTVTVGWLIDEPAGFLRRTRTTLQEYIYFCIFVEHSRALAEVDDDCRVVCTAALMSAVRTHCSAKLAHPG